MRSLRKGAEGKEGAEQTWIFFLLGAIALDCKEGEKNPPCVMSPYSFCCLVSRVGYERTQPTTCTHVHNQECARVSRIVRIAQTRQSKVAVRLHWVLNWEGSFATSNVVTWRRLCEQRVGACVVQWTWGKKQHLLRNIPPKR